MGVSEAIQKAQDKYKASLKVQQEKRKTRPATTAGILQFVNDLYSKYDMGAVPPINKNDKHKITGFIKFLKNNGFEDKEVYEFIESAFSEWGRLCQLEIYTENRKRYTLDTRPNIIDVIHCKTQIFQELKTTEAPEDENMDLLELWRSQND